MVDRLARRWVNQLEDLLKRLERRIAAAIGPGAGTIGGAGLVVSSITLDDQGRITDATTATQAAILVGSGAPASGLGFEGDLYVDAATGDLYLKSGDGWGDPVGNLMGPDGAAGATWRNGAGAPSNGTGADGDYYLDTATGDVYKRASGAYSVVGNIKGSAGAAGATGPGAYLFAATQALATSSDTYFTQYGFQSGSGLASLGTTSVASALRCRVPAGKTIKLVVYNGSVDIPFGQTGTFKLWVSTSYATGYSAVDTVSWANGAGANAKRTGNPYAVGGSDVWVAVTAVNTSGATGGGWAVRVVDSADNS